MTVPAAIAVSPGTFLAIVAASAIAGTISAAVRFGSIVLPVAVLELVSGVILGPQVLGLKVTQARVEPGDQSCALTW